MIFTASAGDNTWDKSCRPDATYGRADGWSLPRLTFLPGGGALESLLGGQSTFAGESITIIDYYYWLHSATIIYYYHRLLPRGGALESLLDGLSIMDNQLSLENRFLSLTSVIDHYHRLLSQTTILVSHFCLGEVPLNLPWARTPGWCFQSTFTGTSTLYFEALSDCLLPKTLLCITFMPALH